LLHEAAHKGSLDCVKFILEMPNADINAPVFKNVGHLYIAAIGQQLDIMRYFLENDQHEPHIQQANGLYANGATALFGAVMGGNAEIVKLLLKHGGPPESPVDTAMLSKEPKQVIARGIQTFQAPVTIEL
jgi:ankyrin repeat protein